MIKNINVRFFAYCLNEQNEIDTVEITEKQFIKLQRFDYFEPMANITYERNSIFENGCRQICLSIEPIDGNYPKFDELERV